METYAACHIHSEWSYDGSWSLEALREKFSRRGCRILMMAEHDRGLSASRWDEYREACARTSTSNLLLVPGIEYSDPSNCVHTLVWGPVPFLGDGLPTREVLEAVQTSGGVAVLAHPSRRKAWACFHPHWGQWLLGIEVWNRKYDGWAPSETAPALLSATAGIPFVGLDFHTQRQLFPLVMALNLRSCITEEEVLRCLKARRCYPRAFGLSIIRNHVRKAFPLLRVAERSRRMARSVIRRSRASSG